MLVEIGRNHGFKSRQIILYHRPNDIRIDAEIVMDKYISHADDLLPFDLIGIRRGFRRQGPDRLANDLQMVQNPRLDQFVFVERRAAASGVFSIRSIASAMSSRRSRSSLISHEPRARSVRGFAAAAPFRSRHPPAAQADFAGP